MPRDKKLVFLIDVDNTLLDNDRVKEDFTQQIEELVGDERARRFWAIYERVRKDYDYVDFPRTLELFAREFPDEKMYPELCSLLLSYPFEWVMFPGALKVIRHLQHFGTVAILSDGDLVFQPAKIGRSGLAHAVNGHVLIFDHKEQHLREVQRRLPADHYIMIDDKPRLLVGAKAILRQKLTTVLVRQGKYALDPESEKIEADIVLDRIAEVADLSLEEFVWAAVRRDKDAAQ